MGDLELVAPAIRESSLRYHPSSLCCLTEISYPNPGPCMVGSLTGAVASQMVTEARNGELKTVGNRLQECNGISSPDCETDKSSRVETRS